MSFLPLPTAQVLGFLGLNRPITIWSRSVVPDAEGHQITTETSVPAQAIVQPIDGREVARLTEGKRTSAGLLFHSATQMPMHAHIEHKQEGDAIAHRWLVVFAPDWKEQGGFYEAVAVAD